MALIQGLTLVQVNESIKIQNTSEPGYDQYVLTSYDGIDSVVLSDNFPPGEILEYSYDSEGEKNLTIAAQKLVKNTFYTTSYSVTFDVGFQPNFDLVYTNPSDLGSSYSGNYIIAGQTFSIQVSEEKTATSPKTYSWNYGRAITYSGPTSNNQILAFSSVGTRTVGLTISNAFGTDFSSIILNSISNPALKIIGSPTFGDVRIDKKVSLSFEAIQNNGHLTEDINVTWQVEGNTYESPSIELNFGSTGIKGVTLLYSSKILTGLSGYTHAQYNVLVPELPVYYDPELMIAFTPQEAGYSYYANEMKKYGIEYKYLTPVATGGYANSTYNASIAAYNSFTYEEQRKPVLINAEYPWLVILYRGVSQGVDSSWATNQTVIQEAQRQGVTLSGLTLSGYKQLGIKCWTDIVDTLRARGCPKMVHYASTGVAFSDYTSIPVGMLEYGPIAGFTANHYWYQANSTFNPIMRTVFENKITQNAYGALIKAQANADANGAAAYSFIPNSPAGLCGISYWSSSDITLVGYSGGTTFINATDFTPETLEEATKVTSAKMWLEFYRACRRSVDLGYISRREIPTKVAAILTFSIPSSFLFTNPGGGWRSRYKFHGSMKKDPQTTAENEVGAIFETNNRIDYSSYDEVKKPDEIWVWDSIKYYNINVPALFVSDPNIVTQSKVQTWMMRNAMEIEFFNRSELSPGNTLWYTGSTADNITYYKNNSLSNYYWNNANSLWWGLSGGTYMNMLPSPCSLTPSSPLAPWLNFNQPIYRNQVFTAIKHKLSTNSLDYLKYSRQKLNELIR